MIELDEHPLLALARQLDATRIELADELGIPRIVFRQLVRGFAAASWRRAREWEDATGGKLSAEAVMRWQDGFAAQKGTPLKSRAQGRHELDAAADDDAD